ncbi:terpenoid synthase [Aulographum hederae CBS 113979]|uniref:Terpene synthase n=1 Tax=Aulographum hederae CBS 113979 TaxID=1176131 RepID=A0A6G1GWU6_9PEZI|nr:terpenoid synthase [Aulographum hederae CBS 113979]
MYWRMRLGIAATTSLIALNEYGCGFELPNSIMRSQDMQDLWVHTNEVIWIVNDLLSFKKEMKDDTVDSIVPLVFHALELPDAQPAVDYTIQSLKLSAVAVERSTRALLAQYRGTPEENNIQAFIDACKYNCTGNLYWSLLNGRYGICHSDVIGAVEFTL